MNCAKAAKGRSSVSSIGGARRFRESVGWIRRAGWRRGGGVRKYAFVVRQQGPGRISFAATNRKPAVHLVERGGGSAAGVCGLSSKLVDGCPAVYQDAPMAYLCVHSLVLYA